MNKNKIRDILLNFWTLLLLFNFLTAFAVTGRGVISAGNDTPAGSSMSDYFARQSPNRETMVVIIQTTPEQDQAAIDSFMWQARTPLEKYPDNCSQRTNDALNAAGIPTADELARTAITFVQPTAMQTNPSLPGTAGNRAQEYNNRAGTGQSVPIPQGTQGLPAPLQQFEPKKPEAVPKPTDEAKEQR